MLESWVALATIVVRTVSRSTRRIHRLGDFAERAQFLDRLREFAGARLHLLEQPHVLDRDHRLVGKSGDQVNLLFRDMVSRRNRMSRKDADRLALSQTAELRDMLRYSPRV